MALVSRVLSRTLSRSLSRSRPLHYAPSSPFCSSSLVRPIQPAHTTRTLSSFSSSSSSSSLSLLVLGAGAALSTLALSLRSVEAEADSPLSDEALLADVSTLITLVDKWVKEGKEIERSCTLLTRLAKLQPNNTEILWRLSRAQYDLALVRGVMVDD
jgi:hypothetical protein